MDPKRVYATRMSNGGMMCYRLAAELSKRIAAIAPVSGWIVFTSPCRSALLMDPMTRRTGAAPLRERNGWPQVRLQMQPGDNELVVEVTNLSANRIRDLDRRAVDWKKFHDINLVNHLYKPFDAAGWDLKPSGLLGPVTLTPLRLIDHGN